MTTTYNYVLLQLRTVLEIPVPKVYAWASLETSHNAVGAEYIIMDKVGGRQLSEVWGEMSDAQKGDLVKSVVAIEAKLAKSRLSKYGSLYFKECCPLEQCHDSAGDVLVDQSQKHPKFIIGPTAERTFWTDGRNTLDIDRGPCEIII